MADLCFDLREKLMYLLYLDDSGSPANPKENHIVLGGFIVPEEKLYWINKNLDDLCVNLSIDIDTEFHASEIFGARKPPWHTIKKEGVDMRDILIKVLNAAKFGTNDISILACAVEKSHFPSDDPMLLAFEDISGRFQMFLQRKYKETDRPANGLIIMDESSYKESMQNLLKRFQTAGNKWNQIASNILEAPLFVDSKISRGIQLADHIAYAIFRRYESADLNYYNAIEGYFDSENKKIHGLSHKTNNNTCTCRPASRHFSSVPPGVPPVRGVVASRARSKSPRQSGTVSHEYGFQV